MRITKDPGERKQELLDTALEMFLENSYEKTAVKDIVSKVGVAQGLFYYYFPSKEDILKEIAIQYVQLYKTMINETGLQDCTDPIRAVKMLLSGSFKFIEIHMDRIEKMHNKGNIELHNVIIFEFIPTITEVVKKVILLGNERGIFYCEYPEKSATALIYGIFSAIHDETKVSIDNIDKEKDFIVFYVSRILNVEKSVLNEIF